MSKGCRIDPLDAITRSHGRYLTENLVFVDSEGGLAPSLDRVLEQAFRCFGGKLRAVPRSTGGLVLAEPCELTVHEGGATSTGSAPAIRVLVRFRDLKRNERGEAPIPEYVMHSKLVAAETLREPFALERHGLPETRFVLDFGHGIVPIRVIAFRPDGDQSVQACFIDVDDSRRIANASAGMPCPARVYEIDREVLRYASPQDFERAIRNMNRISAMGKDPIPRAFARREIDFPGAGQGAKLLEALAKAVRTEAQEATEPGLTRFGTWE